MTDKILVLNGPNLNLLGAREPKLYGKASLEDIYNELKDLATTNNVSLNLQQSNAEHDLINTIQQAPGSNTKFIIINAGAYTHTSIAIRDALLAINIPFIELHISNVYARESFRQKSFLTDIASGVIAGLGTDGYKYALMAAISKLKSLT